MTTTVPAALSSRQLAEEVRKLAATPGEWMARVRLSAEGRWYERILVGGEYACTLTATASEVLRTS